MEEERVSTGFVLAAQHYQTKHIPLFVARLAPNSTKPVSESPHSVLKADGDPLLVALDSALDTQIHLFSRQSATLLVYAPITELASV